MCLWARMLSDLIYIVCASVYLHAFVHMCCGMFALWCGCCCPTKPIYQQTSCLQTIITQVHRQQIIFYIQVILACAVRRPLHRLYVYIGLSVANHYFFKQTARDLFWTATDWAVYCEQLSVIHYSMNSKQDCGLDGITVDALVFLKSS